MAVVAAPFLRLYPFESGDQDEYMEVRAALNFNCRVDELFEQWLDAVAERFPDDKEKQERLIRAFQIEQEAFRIAYQELNRNKQEQKDKKKKKGQRTRTVNCPQTLTWQSPISCGQV